ncbi:MAG: TIGR00269 family protein [Methanobrevibacter sp.]|jgi:uncharacterized protein (TIGR00269 family)|nr:TIGR00269 family protein [Candidatus Methanoflexus mossambicus]
MDNISKSFSKNKFNKNKGIENKFNKNKFNEDLFSNIYNTIVDYNLIEENDLIAIALSGGKDSVLTLHALNSLQIDKNFIDFDIVAISVDEGIDHYRQHGLDAAIENTNELGVELIQTSFKDSFNYKLDDIHSYFKSGCIPCGIFRRNILNKTAYEIGADKIATGHNLDDEIQSFLMSFSRGDTFKFSKFGPKLNRIHPKLVPRIKPLWNVKEKDVGMWAIANNINIHFDECPYSSESLRSKIKGFLNKEEVNNPGLKENIMESFKKSFNIETKIANLNECKLCGEPCSADVCKTCETIKIIENSK